MVATKKAKVRVTLIVEVEVDAAMDDYDLEYLLEEHDCPGTGSVGRMIEAAMRHGEETSTCWACALRGENRVMEIMSVAEGAETEHGQNAAT